MKLVYALIVSIVLAGRAGPQQSGVLPLEARKALAAVSGRLLVPGLARPVQVLRDRWGVAHIYAENQHDLFFAQGFVAAQDRLFQMEVWKRAGQGRLSEILGPAALARDVSARKLIYRGDMNAEYRSYDPDAQEILTAFTDGINSYIKSVLSAGGPGLPVEFKIGGFSPDPWRPQDCLNRMAAYSMTGNAVNELQYAQALTELGAAKTARVVDFDPPVALDPDPKLDLAGLSPRLLDSFVGSDHRIVFPARPIEGSNNWTIAGSRTSTGQPLLANDPHRVVGLPSLRYMVHLVAPGWNVIGAGEPGLPGVALGHNENIAWGFTIFGLDQQDLYVEELNPANPLEYKTLKGWRRMEVRQETFRIRGAAPRQIDLTFTQHGPIIWQDGRRALALRWVGSEPGTAGYLASLAIDRAQNWDQFEAAVARWKVPSENLVYADRAGNIGEHSAGLAPMRHWTGLLPVPGSGGYEWNGFVPVSELPHSFNPPAGYVATANHKMIPDQYPYKVGFEWEPAYRITRIRNYFDEAQRDEHKLTLQDMQMLQNDVTSLAAISFQRLLRSTPLKTDPALQSFMHWNGQLTRESGDAALYEVWFRQIGKAIAQELSPQVAKHYEDLPPNTLLRILASADAEVFGSEPTTRRDQILTETLRTAQQELQKLFGENGLQWQWGKLHQIYFRHALDQESDAVKALVDLSPMSRPGDEYTVNATGFAPDSWEQIEGASYRQIIDTSDWDQSVAVNTPGQSGQPMSVHYADLAPLWDAGRYFPLAYSTKAVQAEKTNELVLEP
jgi:penicillin amidase